MDKTGPPQFGYGIFRKWFRIKPRRVDIFLIARRFFAFGAPNFGGGLVATEKGMEPAGADMPNSRLGDGGIYQTKLGNGCGDVGKQMVFWVFALGWRHSA